MRIKKLVKHNVETLDAYINSEVARQHPRIEDGIVITDNKTPLGIVTPADLAKRRYNLLIDCMTVKPHIVPEEKISVVLDIIKQTGHKVLPVYDGSAFMGTISQSDLLQYLHEQLENQKQALRAAAHDLKSPINTIIQLCSLLSDTLQQKGNLEMISTIQTICDYTQKIIDDILITEQVFDEALQPETLVFDDLVLECFNRLKEQLVQKKLTYEISLAAPVSLRLDRLKVARAITNLLSNSIKFTRAPGHIVVKTLVQKANVSLSVEDNGIGISKQNQKKIFDQFTKAKRTGTAGEPTTGLGLFFTKKIIELHNGTIHLKSGENTGSTFTIFLPVSG